MRMKLRRLVAMGPRILESEAVGFHKQLVVAVMKRVEDVHMELERVAVVVNCSEFRVVVENDELVLVVVVESYSELGVGVEMVVEGNCSELVEVVVKVMVVASGELVEEVMAKVVEVVLYKEVEEVVVVLYKEVGMVEVVNGLEEVENIQALEVVAVINRDKLVVGENVEEGVVSEAVEVVVVVSVVVEVVNYSSMVLVGVGRTEVAVGVVNLVVEAVVSGHNME